MPASAVNPAGTTTPMTPPASSPATAPAAPATGVIGTKPGVTNPGVTNTNVTSGSDGDLGQWLTAAFKRPSGEYHAQSWWGLVPLAANAAIVGTIFYLWEYQAISGVSDLLNSFRSWLTGGYSYGYGYYGYDSTPTVPLGHWLVFFLITLALYYVTVTLCFVGERLYGLPGTFGRTHVRVGQHMMPLTIVNLIALAFASMGGGATSSALLALFGGLLLVFVTPIAYLAHCDSNRSVDRVWLWTVSTAMCLLTHLAFWFVLGSSVFHIIQNMVM
ncbi:hypothetical protein [Bifidobacterium simiarum]|uniref:hypothetical protein n=1 Tax=Bifidobacterium simiarum TaxID=2045441 RepID=UPI001BDC9B16|nr:hypothetical protein [Bifidobacterium simiarum]MBT1166286.1 hypothetical protein [Bifidobacterium simiarum]